MTQERLQYLQNAEAEVESQRGFIQMLDASNQQKKALLEKLREAYEQIDDLESEKNNIIVTGDYVENKTVENQFLYPSPTKLCQKKDQTLSLKEIM